MFEYLQKNLNKALYILKGNNKITEINIVETLKEIHRALIDADVSYKIAKTFVQKIKEKSIGRKVLTSLNPKQLIIKIVYDELVLLMGEKKMDINLSNNPSIILICGLQGSGKTSFSSKLAFFLRKKNKTPLLVAADIHRPAAIDQLKIMGDKENIPVFFLRESKSVIEIMEKSFIYASEKKHNVIIIDTAGRLSIDQIMMDEIKKIHQYSQPSETLFVVDAMTGQDAINTVQVFSKYLNIDGIVMTKLDGDSRGGVAITMSSVVGKPIKFISNGEKVEDMEIFYPERIANRILGMGDIISFVEKVQEQFDEEKTKKIYRKISKNRFDFEDLLEQIQQVKKIGSIKNIVSMIPGMANFFVKDKKDSLNQIESIILSMTPYERNHPKVFTDDIRRKKRISKGAGVTLMDMDLFLKQFYNISRMMKTIKENSGKEIIKNFLSKIINKENNNMH
ncbi:MAG: signal recognition particle protein [Flavobacteriales bacterium]|jgi:signal recognition particle subunit SRP54|uniref:signal recognition particle protein n=1 Tax=Blattabacterium sp. (Mastotermes darwiniensis) TaxID=39768 RepID=UPI000231DDBD|nr:signal recognition particle protein [Blattabacterium sp. (Mastotermes darwiniensis)]AER40497.1 signal recognition particle protein [Blattabacterium sp. (Mastotermes darwiniensis) str. MADAR]MDR1804988.1 signal recognition particle protein [Flavobacteriales bacterium]